MAEHSLLENAGTVAEGLAGAAAFIGAAYASMKKWFRNERTLQSVPKLQAELLRVQQDQVKQREADARMIQAAETLNRRFEEHLADDRRFQEETRDALSALRHDTGQIRETTARIEGGVTAISRFVERAETHHDQDGSQPPPPKPLTRRKEPAGSSGEPS